MEARTAPPPEDDWIDEPSEGDYEPPTETDETDTDLDDEAYEEALEDLEEAIAQGEIEVDEDEDEVETDTDTMDIDAARETLVEILEETEEEVPIESAASASATAETNAAPPAPQTRRLAVSRNQLLQLFARRSFRQLLQEPAGLFANDDDDDDDDDEPYGRIRRRPRQRKPGRRMSELYPVPSEKGQELMESGVFGVNERDTGQYTRKKKVAARIMRRELALGSPGKERASRRLVSQSLVPESKCDTIVHYNDRCYSGQFSDDGNFFYSCVQDFRVRMYDTSNPYSWRYYKTVLYPYGQWTITDATLSPDNKWLAYSSIRSTVCLANTDPEPSDPHLLDFSDVGRGTGRHRGGGHFGIWSLRFSGDGREIVAGTSDQSVYVYDLESRQSILRIPGHDDDVNAVCYGDQSSPHILYSGSDDTTLKVWDRRSLGDSREAGVFLGHTEGLTYIDSKGDGRYVLSNGKDQSMKLWDLRKMHSTEDAARAHTNNYSTGFDYRFQAFDEADFQPHPQDCSIVTFRGHAVLKTLIRCHFSPPGSTDSRYVYTGSADGCVYVYNIDGTIAKKLDVETATRDSRPRDGLEDYHDGRLYEDRRGQSDWKTCVRDASWHPNAPVISATSWNGYGMRTGTCTVHNWNDGLDVDEGSPPMGQSVNAQLGSPDWLKEDGRADRRGVRTGVLRAARRPAEDD